MSVAVDIAKPDAVVAIAALDEAQYQLGVAIANKDATLLLDLADKAEVLKRLLKVCGMSQELADDAGELKIRAQAALGKLDLAVVAGRGPRKRGGPVFEMAPLVNLQTARRSMYRTLGLLAADQLDSVIRILRSDANQGVTTARAVRVARGLLPMETREDGVPRVHSFVQKFVTQIVTLRKQVTATAACAPDALPELTTRQRARLGGQVDDCISDLISLRTMLKQ